MFTHNYKGMYINGYFGREECYVPGLGEFKSYRAAQLAITKAVKAHDAAMVAAVKAGKL
jgi:hypothetical protein